MNVMLYLDCYDSVLLRSVAHCRPERLQKYHKILSTTLTTDEDNAHILEKILCWENEVYFNDIFHRYISSMWEVNISLLTLKSYMYFTLSLNQFSLCFSYQK